MERTEHVAEAEAGAVRVRVVLGGAGEAHVATGLSILDHLLGLLAKHASADLSLEVAPGAADAEVAAAGRALGEALKGPLHAPGATGHGSAVLPADEALAHVALEASGRPLLVSNVDLSEDHVAGLRRDLVSNFLEELTEAAGLTLHVRLIGGHDARHVLDAIFKALGVAIAKACAPRGME